MGEDQPELPEKPRRRTFTAEYILAVLEQYDACVGDGDKGALLRREGLYSSTSPSGARRATQRRSRGWRPGSANRSRPPRPPPWRRPTAASPASRTSWKHKLALDIAGKAHARLEMLAEGAAPEQKPKQ